MAKGHTDIELVDRLEKALKVLPKPDKMPYTIVGNEAGEAVRKARVETRKALRIIERKAGISRGH